MIPEEFGMGAVGWIGTTIAAVATTALGMRRWLSKDASTRAEDSTNIQFLETLMAQLKASNERADRVERERNLAVEQIGDLKAQVAALQVTMNHMQEQLSQMCLPQPTQVHIIPGGRQEGLVDEDR